MRPTYGFCDEAAVATIRYEWRRHLKASLGHRKEKAGVLASGKDE